MSKLIPLEKHPHKPNELDLEEITERVQANKNFDKWVDDWDNTTEPLINSFIENSPFKNETAKIVFILQRIISKIETLGLNDFAYELSHLCNQMNLNFEDLKSFNTAIYDLVLDVVEESETREKNY